MSDKFHKTSRFGMSQRKRSESSRWRSEITPRQIIVQKICLEADSSDRVTRLAAILSDALSRRLARPHRYVPTHI